MSHYFRQPKIWSSVPPLSEKKATDIVFLRALSYFCSGKDVCGAAYFNEKLNEMNQQCNPLLLAWNRMSKKSEITVNQGMKLLSEYTYSEEKD